MSTPHGTALRTSSSFDTEGDLDELLSAPDLGEWTEPLILWAPELPAHGEEGTFEEWLKGADTSSAARVQSAQHGELADLEASPRAGAIDGPGQRLPDDSPHHGFAATHDVRVESSAALMEPSGSAEPMVLPDPYDSLGAAASQELPGSTPEQQWNGSEHQRQLPEAGRSESGTSLLPLGAPAKPRLRWTPELHARFVTAVTQLGGPELATPKGVLKVMAVQGLTIYHIKSHLQKYRLSMKLPEHERASAFDFARPRHTKSGSRLHDDSEEDSDAEDLAAAVPPVRSSRDRAVGRGKRKAPASTDDDAQRQTKLEAALLQQLEMQKKLHEQLEAQRQLQMRLETHQKHITAMLKGGGVQVSKLPPTLLGVENFSAPQHSSELATQTQYADAGGAAAAVSVMSGSAIAIDNPDLPQPLNGVAGWAQPIPAQGAGSMPLQVLKQD